MKKLPLLTIILILLVCGYFMKTVAWDGKNGNAWKSNLSGYDTKAYYSYLPKLFINHNLKITDSTLPYVNVTEKGVFNKHFIGPAVLWSPFFISDLEYFRLENKPTDGYSALFIKSIGIAALCWLFIGLYCLWKTLKFFDISEIVISITLLLITFGTNLFYYSFKEYMMAHLYSFSLLSAFIYMGMKYCNSGKKVYLIWMSAAFGLSVIVRPTAICLLPCLLPLTCGNMKKTIRTFFTPLPLTIAICIIVPIIFLQSLAWHMQTGHWIVGAYSDERFYFFHPEIFKALFSFQNGWFIYTPLALLSLLGFINLYKINKTAFWSCFFSIALWVYLVASYFSWSYEDGFEHRAFIDIYPILAIGMAHLFPSVKNQVYFFISGSKKKIVTIALAVICSLLLSLNLIQTYQFTKRILVSYWMDWDSYKYVFLKTSDKYIDCLGGHKDLPPYTNKPPQLVISSRLDFAKPECGWKVKQPETLNGKQVIYFRGDEYGVSFNIPSDSLYGKRKRYYTKISLTRFEPDGNSSSGVLLANDVTDTNNNHEYYNAFKINDYPSGKDSNTRTYYYEFHTPGLIHKDSKMSFYIWNKDYQNFYLTGLTIEIYRYFP